MKNGEPLTRDGCRFGRARWIGLALAGVVAAVASYRFLDPVVTGWLWDHRVAWHENLWANGFRQLGKASVPIWLLVVWSCLTDKWRPTVVTVTAMLLAGATVCPLKALVPRSRPYDGPIMASGQLPPEEPGIACSRRMSFPSGDTAVVFAVAGTLSYFLSRLWTPLLFAVAGVIAVLRVTSLAHYPSDVVAGATIGLLCGAGAVRWMAHREAWDRTSVKGLWRFNAVLVLAFVVPFISPLLGLESLRIFLDAYLIPLAALILIYWVARRL